MSVERWIELTPHPSAQFETLRNIQARVRRTADRELHFGFRIDGEISRLRVPAPGPQRFATELWRHTCCEAFIAIERRRAYHEFNFSPSGEWAVYAFSSYRQGGPVAGGTMRPRIVAHSTQTRLELDAVVKLDRLSAEHARAPLRIGLAAVIETPQGLSYWALRHPDGRPDFHHGDGFVLLLERPDAEG